MQAHASRESREARVRFNVNFESTRQKSMFKVFLKVEDVYEIDNISVKSSSTIGELKAIAIDKLGEIVSEGCVFFSSGKKLQDDSCSLGDYKINDGSTIYVGVRKKKKNNQPKAELVKEAPCLKPVVSCKPYEKRRAPTSDGGLSAYIDYFQKNEGMLTKAVADYLATLREVEYERQRLTDEEWDNFHLLAERLWNREGPPVLPDYIHRTKLARPCKCRPGLVRWFPIGRLVYYASFDELPEELPREWAEDVWEPGSEHVERASRMYAQNRRRWFSYGLFSFFCGEEENLEDDEMFARWFRSMVTTVVGDLYDEQLLGDTLYYDFDVNASYELFCSTLLTGCCLYYAPR